MANQEALNRMHARWDRQRDTYGSGTDVTGSDAYSHVAGIRLHSCRTCGATVDSDSLDVHDRWHVSHGDEGHGDGVE